MPKRMTVQVEVIGPNERTSFQRLRRRDQRGVVRDKSVGVSVTISCEGVTYAEGMVEDPEFGGRLCEWLSSELIYSGDGATGPEDMHVADHVWYASPTTWWLEATDWLSHVLKEDLSKALDRLSARHGELKRLERGDR